MVTLMKPASWSSPPSVPDPHALREARQLPLSLIPVSDTARALTDAVLAHVSPLTDAGRQRARRSSGSAKLRAAVGAIVGGLLRRWAGDQPSITFRAMRPEDFTGAPVGYRQARPVMDALVQLGLVAKEDGISWEAWPADGNIAASFSGLASKFWPTALLLTLAAEHGVTPASVKEDWQRVPSIKPVPPKEPLVLRPLATDRRQRVLRSLPIPAESVTAAALRSGVEAHNAFAATFTVEGCTPPRWRRIFHGAWSLGGAWHSSEPEPYQTMSEEERLAGIRINGEPVAEIDVTASRLSILYGLAGLAFPDADPYIAPGVPRHVGKHFVNASLGKGSPLRRWTQRTPANVRQFNVKDVAATMLASHPVLAEAENYVPPGLRHLHENREKLVAHFLAAIEAQALTHALETMRSEHGILALPLFDCLLVPRSAADFAETAVRAGYERAARITPRLTVSP